jgi:N-glycosylase/DNA lyase
VFSHGWCALAPFRIERRPLAIEYPVRLRRGVALIRAVSTGRGSMAVTVRAARPPGARAMDECAAIVRSMFRLDLDLAPLHRRLRRDPVCAWMARARAGRLLRAATFFEDAVKMILTTNCSWALTTLMTRNLVERFGEEGPDGTRTFPDPAAVAASSERELRERLSLGYRAPFVLDLARRSASGELAIEDFRDSREPAPELYARLLALRGVGPYAAGNLLKLLGRFEYLGLDSWCRAQYSRLHAGGGPADDRAIQAHYAPYGEWQGLVMWLDLTREWYRRAVPFTA